MVAPLPRSFMPFGSFEDADLAANQAGQFSGTQIRRINQALPKVLWIAGILYAICVLASWYTRNTACWRFVGCQQVDDGNPIGAFLVRATASALPCAVLVWVAWNEARKRRTTPIQHLRGAVRLDSSVPEHPKRFLVTEGGGEILIGYGTSSADGPYAPGDVYDVYFADASPPQGALLLSSRLVQD